MTKLTVKEMVINSIEKREARIIEAGLIATAQVKTQIISRAMTILEGKKVNHMNTVNAAVNKAIPAVAKFAKQSVNEKVTYMVVEGTTQNIGIVLGTELAGNIDLLAFEAVIALALSNGQTTKYPTVVAEARGMGKIEDLIADVLAGTVVKEKRLLTIGAYVSVITEEKLQTIKDEVIRRCTKARNGAVKKMQDFLTEEAKRAEQLAQESIETARAAGVPEDKIIHNNEELKQFFEVMTDETTTIDLDNSTVEQPAVITADQEVTATSDETPVNDRYAKNIAHITKYLQNLGYTGDKLTVVLNQIIADNEERLHTFAFTNLLFDSVKTVLDTALAKLASINPANDESSEAEQNNEDKGEKTMNIKHETFLAELGGKEVEMMKVADYVADVTKLMDLVKSTEQRFQTQIDNLIKSQEQAQDDARSDIQVKLDEALKVIAELTDAKVKAEGELSKQKTLRKADAHKINKLEKEVGRVKITLKEHKARQISEDKVTVVPDVEIGGVVKSRIQTAGAIDKAAQKVHAAAPEKIAAGAEKTKDGIQWVADRAKDGVDAGAKGMNWSVDKLANGATVLADVIAPKKETVAKSAMKKAEANDDKKNYIIIDGVKFIKNDKGELVFA